MAHQHPADRQRHEAHPRGIGPDAAGSEGMLATGGEAETEACAAEHYPHAEDDERHGGDRDRQHAIGAEGRPELRNAERCGHARLASEDRLNGERRATEAKARQAEAGDDRIGLEPVDDEPEEDGGKHTDEDGDEDGRNDGVGQHDADDRGAGTHDHQALETEVPHPCPLRNDASEGDVDQRRPGTQDGDDDLVHDGRPPRRSTWSTSFDLAVMNSAIAALMMSIAAAGSPAMIGR